MDKDGFNEWAGEYDDSVSKSQEGYPFEGYYEVLAFVWNILGKVNNKKILDLGVGTGLLSHELYKNGSEIVGVDFSQEMIDRAKEKMPKAIFYLHDLKEGIPEELSDEKFDNIVSSYALHHLRYKLKIELICSLKGLLTEEGSIIIADVSFRNSKERERCRKRNLDRWDHDEYYMVAQEICGELKNMWLNCSYTQVSSCAGVLIIN